MFRSFKVLFVLFFFSNVPDYTFAQTNQEKGFFNITELGLFLGETTSGPK